MKSFALLFMMAAITIGRAPAQAPHTLAEGVARLQAGDAASAVRILEEVTTREPANGRAWRVYGTALVRTKALDHALHAFQKAMEVEPAMPTPLYHIGVVYALKGNGDEAFAWLAKAKATGRIDMSQIQADGDLETLKSDRRFAALIPKPEDFTPPFTDPVKIVREWDGEAMNDQFGWIARTIGDVDRDGVLDIVTSAPDHGSGGDEAGRIYTYSTKSGRLLWTADGQPHDELGAGVEGAGDTNGDGVPDVIASAPGSGRAYVYSGSNGRILLTLRAEAGKEDDFGRHVSGAGDVNGDGCADVIVGAPGHSAAGSKTGRAYVYSGKDGRVLLTLTGERAGDRFGSAVAGHTDTRGTFLIVGAPGGGPRRTGRVSVYRGLSASPAFTIDSDDTGAALGAMFVSVLGDVDGDGVPDVYASDWSNGARGPSTGRVYVHSGKDGHRLWTFTGETAGEGFGIGPAAAGDVDGDGRADLIVGSWQYSKDAISGGRAYLYSGKTGELLKTYTGRIPGDTFGFDAVGIGDVDGDGTIDLLITSAWSGIHGFHSGRMFIISSK